MGDGERSEMHAYGGTLLQEYRKSRWLGERGRGHTEGQADTVYQLRTHHDLHVS